MSLKLDKSKSVLRVITQDTKINVINIKKFHRIIEASNSTNLTTIDNLFPFHITNIHLGNNKLTNVDFLPLSLEAFGCNDRIDYFDNLPHGLFYFDAVTKIIRDLCIPSATKFLLAWNRIHVTLPAFSKLRRVDEFVKHTHNLIHKFRTKHTTLEICVGDPYHSNERRKIKNVLICLNKCQQPPQ